MNIYEWMRQRRRLKRQEERKETNLDDKLSEGFKLLADDEDLSDDHFGCRRLSSEADARNKEDGR